MNAESFAYRPPSLRHTLSLCWLPVSVRLVICAISFLLLLTFSDSFGVPHPVSLFPTPRRASQAEHGKDSKTSHTSKPASHPINRLILAAEAAQSSLLRKETLNLHDAAAAYRARRGRHPPPRFDRWYQWAKERDVLMIEELWDTLYDGLEQFWDVPADLVRDFPRSWPAVISIRQGKVFRWEDEPSRNLDFWLWRYQGAFEQLPLEDMPDIDLAFVDEDEPKVIVPWEVKNRHLTAARARKIATAPLLTAPTVTDFTNRERLPSTRPPLPERTHFQWADIDDTISLWAVARNACSPDSQAGQLPPPPASEDYTLLPRFPDHVLDHMDQGYIANWSNAKSVCENPHLGNLHGSFVSMHPWTAEDRIEGKRSIIAHPVPLLAGCKIHDINGEILIPPAMQWPRPEDPAGYSFVFNESERVSWPDKHNKVMWRGSSSSGANKPSNWMRFQRLRFMAMLNGTLVAQHQDTINRGSPVPAHVPGGSPNLPYNFPLPNTALYPLNALDGDTSPDILKEWIESNADGGFVSKECDFNAVPLDEAFAGKHCRYYDPWYDTKARVAAAEQFSYKYQPDLDGHSYSGRYQTLLASNSAPIKATIYDEWHDSRLIPWKHFIPMDNTFMDWWGIFEYLLGFGHDPGHDEVGRKIALDGSEWIKRNLRLDDQLAYMYRLTLELARLQDERRDDMGWAGDLESSSSKA